MWGKLVETDGEAVRRFEYVGEKNETNSRHELHEALRSIESTLSKCEKTLTKLREGTSQHTLTIRWIDAFRMSDEENNRTIESNVSLLKELNGVKGASDE